MLVLMLYKQRTTKIVYKIFIKLKCLFTVCEEMVWGAVNMPYLQKTLSSWWGLSSSDLSTQHAFYKLLTNLSGMVWGCWQHLYLHMPLLCLLIFLIQMCRFFSLFDEASCEILINIMLKRQTLCSGKMFFNLNLDWVTKVSHIRSVIHCFTCDLSEFWTHQDFIKSQVKNFQVMQLIPIKRNWIQLQYFQYIKFYPYP